MRVPPPVQLRGPPAPERTRVGAPLAEKAIRAKEEEEQENLNDEGSGTDGINRTTSLSNLASIAGLGVEEVCENLRMVVFEVRLLAWSSLAFY